MVAFSRLEREVLSGVGVRVSPSAPSFSVVDSMATVATMERRNEYRKYDGSLLQDLMIEVVHRCIQGAVIKVVLFSFFSTMK